MYRKVQGTRPSWEKKKKQKTRKGGSEKKEGRKEKEGRREGRKDKREYNTET